MANQADQLAIEAAIEAALELHRTKPYAIMRERGAVADLRERLMSAASLGRMIDATPIIPTTRGKPWYAYERLPLKVYRTQLEIGVRHADPLFGKAVDIAILRETPSLAFGAWGSGDVLQQFALRDIDAAIEVKTSQSSDPAARGSYVRDVWALLRIRELSLAADQSNPAHCYFVLVDRNDPVYGAWLHGSEGQMVWDPAAEQLIQLRRKGFQNRTVPGLRACGLDLADSPPTHTDIWVKCYILDSTRDTARSMYAFMTAERPPADVIAYVL